MMQKYIQPIKKKKAFVIRGKVSETGKSILQKMAFALVQEEEFVFNEIQVNILILADHYIWLLFCLQPFQTRSCPPTATHNPI